MLADPNAYFDTALTQIPRILSLLDRNPLSRTYGCFNRAYWHHRTADFPAAINQMGAETLAILWSRDLPNNPYYHNPKIFDWCIASIKFWMNCQHRDGSFDEWYPNERGWAGPTGYLVHAMCNAYFELGGNFPVDLKPSFMEAVRKSAHFLMNYDEEFVLANHHAIALLPIYETCLITKDQTLHDGFEKKFQKFLTYYSEEGWFLEYDGVDIGYLAGTISFLSRLYRHWPDPRIPPLIERAVEFSSYFLYPDGYFGGTVGSRQTSHFYHFGYEFWSDRIPLAATMAENGLKYLAAGQLVPPGTQEDHYIFYRLNEYLEAYLAYKPRPINLPVLPFQKNDFHHWFPQAKIYVERRAPYYFVINLGKGGVIKGFDCRNNKSVVNDSGWIARLSDGKTVTSQWNDPDYKTEVTETLTVSGPANRVVMKVFTPFKMIVFRAVMLLLGWHPTLAYHIKAVIRKMMMVGTRKSPLHFKRTIRIAKNSVFIQDDLFIQRDVRVDTVYCGDEVPVRYVPQSRYFQPFELDIRGFYLSGEQITSLNQNHKISIQQ